MPWDTLQNIQSIHYDFLRHFLEASQFEATPASALPTFTFFVFTFILFHRILHRYTSVLTPLKEIGFQWSFFYIIRVWFFSVKGMKWLTNVAEEYLQDQHIKGNFLWLDHTQVQASLFAALTLVGMIPVTVVIMDCFWKHTIPNFLMWVGEDPWIRSEIGISGHYLDRPPNFPTPRRKEYAYRSRRSISAEYTSPNPSIRPPIRNCRSMNIVTGANSVNTFT